MTWREKFENAIKIGDKVEFISQEDCVIWVDRNENGNGFFENTPWNIGDQVDVEELITIQGVKCFRLEGDTNAYHKLSCATKVNR